ncbi:MAG: isochorismatase family cysteine hydrolase [Lacisediminihabitans sp.]
MSSDPSNTAVVIIDMQKDFCSPDGAMAALGADISRNTDVAARLPQFLDSARAAGCLIVWVTQSRQEKFLSAARRSRAKAMQRGAMTVCAAGSWGAELAEGLQPNTNDVVIEKPHYSAFVGTPLDNLLRATERSNLVVCGTAANVCVDSTIRDAYMSEFTVTLASDLVGWTRQELAEPAIANLEFYFCDVESSDDILARWNS